MLFRSNFFKTEIHSDRKELKKIAKPQRRLNSICNRAIVDPNANNFVNLIRRTPIHTCNLYWMQGLRGKYTPRKKITQSEGAPDVYSKPRANSCAKTLSDIKYKGNSSDIWHLMKSKGGKKQEGSLIRFEIDLRNYKTTRDPEDNKKSHKVKLQQNKGMEIFPDTRKYTDKFRVRNMGTIRNLLDSDIHTIYWESGLRNY